MSHELMMGMLWAGIVMVGVPLAIGIGIAVLVIRRRASESDRGRQVGA